MRHGYTKGTREFVEDEHGDGTLSRLDAGQSPDAAAARAAGQFFLAEPRLLARPADVGPQTLVRRTRPLL